MLIVLVDGESEEDAILRWCENNQKPGPDNILFVSTGVVNSCYDD